MGQRIFLFIIGGATRSEVSFLKHFLFLEFQLNFGSHLMVISWCYCQLRVCHKLTTKLRREVVLGSSCIDDPLQYITVINVYSLFFLITSCSLLPRGLSPCSDVIWFVELAMYNLTEVRENFRDCLIAN